MTSITLNPKSVFITGCNRGIGLELVKQFLKLPCAPKHIFVTCRNPDHESAKELQAFAAVNHNVHILKLDVTNYDALPDIVKEVEEKLEGDGLNLLINNAGIAIRATLDAVTAQNMRDVFEVNTIAPLMITKALLPLLKKAASTSTEAGLNCSKAAVINISSKVGSCADNKGGGGYSYRSSKAALNMVTKSFSVDLHSSGILAAVIHPGWVQTEMGGPNSLISTEVSVQGMLQVIGNLAHVGLHSVFSRLPTQDSLASWVAVYSDLSTYCMIESLKQNVEVADLNITC